MRSVADELRMRDRERMPALPVSDRVRLAFALGDLAVECFSAYNGVPEATARLVKARIGTLKAGGKAIT